MISYMVLASSCKILGWFLQALARVLRGSYKLLQESCVVLTSSCKSLAWFLQALARVLRGSYKLLQESCVVLTSSCKSLAWFLQALARASCIACNPLQHVIYFHKVNDKRDRLKQ